MVFAFAILVLIFRISDVPAWVRENPVGFVAFICFVASYIVSFVCLSKMRKPDASDILLLWLISLAAVCAPLAGLACMGKSITGALVIGMVESVVVLLHLIAIGIIVVRRHNA